MKIVVIGGSGLIGTKVVKKLTDQGYEALAASPKSGVDARPAKVWPRRWLARRWSWTSRTLRPSIRLEEWLREWRGR